jgi:hypothetical protein
MGTVSDDIGRYEFTREWEGGAAALSGAGRRGGDGG